MSLKLLPGCFDRLALTWLPQTLLADLDKAEAQLCHSRDLFLLYVREQRHLPPWAPVETPLLFSMLDSASRYTLPIAFFQLKSSSISLTADLAPLCLETLSCPSRAYRD